MESIDLNSDLNQEEIAEFDKQFLFENQCLTKTNNFIRKNLSHLKHSFSNEIQDDIKVNLANNNVLQKSNALLDRGSVTQNLPGIICEKKIFKYSEQAKAQHEWNFRYFESERHHQTKKASEQIGLVEQQQLKIEQNITLMKEKLRNVEDPIMVIINQESVKIEVVLGLESQDEEPDNVVRDLSTDSDQNPIARFRSFSYCINISYQDYFMQSKQNFVNQTIRFECGFPETKAPMEIQEAYSLNIIRPKTLVIDVMEVIVESFDGKKLVLRPHTISFLKCVNPFFELVAFSNIDINLLRKIILAIEDEINGPLLNVNNQSIGSTSSVIYSRNIVEQPKQYFNMIIGHEHYYQQNDYKLEDLSMLLMNRTKESIIMMTNQPYKVAAALSKGYSVLPIVHTETFELILAEIYLLTQRYRETLRKDFSFLIPFEGQYTEMQKYRS